MAAMKLSHAMRALGARARWRCVHSMGAAGRLLDLKSLVPVAILLWLCAAAVVLRLEQRWGSAHAAREVEAPQAAFTLPTAPRVDPRLQTLQELDALAVPEADLPEVLAASLAVWEAQAWTVAKVDYQWQTTQLGGLGRLSLHMSLSGPADRIERAVDAVLLNQRAFAVQSFQVQREAGPNGRLGLQLVLQLLFKPRRGSESP